MALFGELLGFEGAVCCCCGADLELKVLRTNAYYLGYFCDKDGPISRETGYYPTKEEAEEQLAIAQAGGFPKHGRI